MLVDELFDGVIELIDGIVMCEYGDVDGFNIDDFGLYVYFFFRDVEYEMFVLGGLVGCVLEL